MIFKTQLADFTKEDGSKNVVVYIYSSGKKCLIKTEHYVKPEQFKDGSIISKGKHSHPNGDYINADVEGIKNKLQRYALSNPGITPQELKKYHDGDGTLSLFEFTEEFIQGIKSGKILIKGKRSMNKGKPYAPNTSKSYVTYTNYLKEFNPSLNWSDITEDFFNDYVVWMQENDYSDNTIAKAIKILCAIMRRGSKHHNNKEFENFEAAYVDTDNIYLDEKEMTMILNANLPPHLVDERRRFYLSYNFFLRYGDSINVAKKDIFIENKKHFVRFMDEKTKNRVIIPLLPHTISLLEECNYKLPKTTNQESNWKIKEIGKLAGITQDYTMTRVHKGKKETITAAKHHFITTHTARRSMATNYYLSMAKHGNIDLKSLQLMGGWKSIAMLEKYLKIARLENALKASEHPFFN